MFTIYHIALNEMRADFLRLLRQNIAAEQSARWCIRSLVRRGGFVREAVRRPALFRDSVLISSAQTSGRLSSPESSFSSHPYSTLQSQKGETLPYETKEAESTLFSE